MADSILFDIDPRDPRPMFRQIVDEVYRCVSLGILKPNDGLPPVRPLAAQLGINFNTVQHAYRTLEQEGIAYVRRGIGTFIATKPPEARTARQVTARRIAHRMLREAYRHGLLASDLAAALDEIAPRSR